jgi:ParB family chromosome partitioning protein
MATSPPISSAIQIEIDRIDPNPKQPRTSIDPVAQEELTASVREHGVLVPIRVEARDGRYALIAGQRRLLAARAAGLKAIPAVVVPEREACDRLIEAITENLQRQDMSPVDLAESYRVLIEEWGMTAHAVAQEIGKSRAHVDNLLLINRLDEGTKGLISCGDLSHDPRLIRALLKIEAEPRRKLVQRMVLRHASTAESILLAQKLAEKLNGAKLEAETPSLALAKLNSRKDEPEQAQPSNWDALQEIGLVPSWQKVVAGARHACATCDLRELANSQNCGPCPLVVMLKKMLEIAYD